MALDRWPVVLLPGIVMPAQLAYRSLALELAKDADARIKDLEIYRSDAVPPPGYSLRTEVDGIRRTADEAGFERFHLVGYSAGGAASLAFASSYPERLRSLALLEPARAGSAGMSAEEAAVQHRLSKVATLPPDQRMSAFVKAQLADGVEPPPPPTGPPPPWMASRVTAIRAFVDVLEAFEPDWEALRRFDRPVYFALGGRSNPDLYARTAERLRKVFVDFTLDVFPERHHFDPPHRVEPIRMAAALRALWTRAG